MKIITTTLFLFICFCCQRTEPPKDTIASAGKRYITATELQQRAENSPELFIHSPKPDKEKLVDILIVEKLLAQHARELGLDDSEKMKELTGFIEMLALNRVLYKEKVRKKVTLTAGEIDSALQFLAQQRSVSLFYFKDTSRAQKFYDLFSSSGSACKALAACGNLEVIDTTAYQKEITWGEMMVLDDVAYRLSKGEISPLIDLKPGFAVMRIDHISRNVVISKSEKIKLMIKAKRILRARKEAESSADYVSQFMQQQNIRFVEAVADPMLDILARRLYEVKSDAGVGQPFVLSQRFLESAQSDQVLNDEIVVYFKEGHIKVSSFIENWHAFHFPIRQGSLGLIKKQLNDQFSLVLREWLLAREAKRLGYGKRPGIQVEKQIWQDYYLSEAVANIYGARLINQIRALIQKNQIFLYPHALQYLDFTPIPVLAVRPGQYASRPSPPWPSYAQEIRTLNISKEIIKKP